MPQIQGCMWSMHDVNEPDRGEGAGEHIEIQLTDVSFN